MFWCNILRDKNRFSLFLPPPLSFRWISNAFSMNLWQTCLYFSTFFKNVLHNKGSECLHWSLVSDLTSAFSKKHNRTFCYYYINMVSFRIPPKCSRERFIYEHFFSLHIFVPFSLSLPPLSVLCVYMHSQSNGELSVWFRLWKRLWIQTWMDFDHLPRRYLHDRRLLPRHSGRRSDSSSWAGLASKNKTNHKQSSKVIYWKVIYWKVLVPN